MSDIIYGLISPTDGRTLEKTIDLICDQFKYGATDGIINVVEVGVYGGDTGMGICEYIKSKGRNYWITGVDNFREGEAIRFPYNELIKGNSNEVYNQLEDESQHLIFQDANHTFPMTISDFFCFERKVKKGGYYAIHDCGSHIASKTGYQYMGSEDDEDMYISCRKAIKKIGLLDNKFEG